MRRGDLVEGEEYAIAPGLGAYFGRGAAARARYVGTGPDGHSATFGGYRHGAQKGGVRFELLEAGERHWGGQFPELADGSTFWMPNASLVKCLWSEEAARIEQARVNREREEVVQRENRELVEAWLRSAGLELKDVRLSPTVSTVTITVEKIAEVWEGRG